MTSTRDYLDQQQWLHAKLDASPTGMVCGARIEWTDFNGRTETLSCYGFDTPREARKAILRSAIKSGWTYPRWWQFWRWDDTRPNLDFSK